MSNISLNTPRDGDVVNTQQADTAPGHGAEPGGAPGPWEVEVSSRAAIPRLIHPNCRWGATLMQLRLLQAWQVLLQAARPRAAKRAGPPCFRHAVPRKGLLGQHGQRKPQGCCIPFGNQTLRGLWEGTTLKSPLLLTKSWEIQPWAPLKNWFSGHGWMTWIHYHTFKKCRWRRAWDRYTLLQAGIRQPNN